MSKQLRMRHILEQRANRYGPFDENAEVWRRLVCWVGADPTNPHIPAVVCAGADMILWKVTRIVRGDCYYLDNYHDIQGYAKRVLDTLPDPAVTGFPRPLRLPPVAQWVIPTDLPEDIHSYANRVIGILARECERWIYDPRPQTSAVDWHALSVMLPKSVEWTGR